MDKKVNTTNVGERINDTKKEIAQLSQELEKLIKSNAGLSNINFERGNTYDENNENPEETEDRVIASGATKPNIESSNKKADVAGKTAILPEAKSKSELPCNKRNVGHNKEITRQFMKQQREKREEQKKKTDSKNKIDQELKKQKLQELQQKSIALVQRNLQLKRERSKSRERKQQVRLDKSNSGNSALRKSSTELIPIRKLAPQVTNFKKAVKIQDKPLVPPKITIESKVNQSSISQKPPTLSEGKPCSSENQKVQEHFVQNRNDKDKAARKIQVCFRDYRTRKQLATKKTEQKEQEKDNLVKESKQTQTFMLEQMDFPAWLQPPTIDPYPCNFINTIKKKLQLVVNSPVRCKDVGIQNSIMEKEPSLQQLPGSSQKLSKENLTALSHSNNKQITNLDADALQQFALTQFREKYSKFNKVQSRSDSESDTSKNIPEISTESGLISDEKINPSDKILSIDTDKIKNLTLRKKTNDSFPDVHKNLSKKSYTFNFSEENDSTNTDIPSEKIQSEESYSKQFVRSPRDSILSFNISNDSGSPSIVSQKNKHSISSEEIKTERSSISSEKENSRRRLIFPTKDSITLSDGISNNENGKITDNKDLSKNSLRSLSDHVSSSLRTNVVPHFSQENKNSSQTSSVSSRHSIKSTNSLKKKEEILSRSPSFPSVKTDTKPPKSDSESSEVIMTNSSISSIATASLKSSNPNNLIVSSKVKNEDVKSYSEMEFHSLVNSSNESKVSRTRNKSITDLSEIDSPKVTSRISELMLDLKEFNSDTEVNQSVRPGHDRNSVETSPAKESFVSNRRDSNKNYQVVKDIKSRVVQSKNDTNEIHLKFEAEVHLLNDFNDSLKQFMAAEKAFESLKNESSFRNSSKNSSAITIPSDDKRSSDLSKNIYSTINLSRGSDLDESFQVDDTVLKTHLKSSNNMELSSMQKSAFEHDTFSFNENVPNNLAGLSIKMFEQFIKDEDVRIENLKTIIKIREQALLDRTKGELAWLEIQRKHLKETGKLHEASLVKKKQRGILLKHQQERREMQRLKQLQKLQSNERKTILKEQKNLIKAKLTSEKLMSEMKMQTPRKQRPSGPMKVLKASESHSETSLSRRTSDAEEIFSITSRSRSIKLSEVDSSREVVLKQEEFDVKSIGDTEDIDNMKKALLVRQASLMKRRKAVEDLLKRHQKLLEEEKKIKELEMAANAIIMKLPSKTVANREPRIKSHLREVNSKGTPFIDNESLLQSTIKQNVSHQKDESQILSKTNVSISEYSFNAFYENAKATINKMKDKQNVKEEMDSSNSLLQKGSSVDYSEDFESEKQVETESTENNLSSISELIEDFTQIEYGISMFSKQFNENTVEPNSNLERLNEPVRTPTSEDSKKTLNISSWPKEESVVPSEELEPVMNTEEVQSHNDTLTLVRDEEVNITTEKQTDEISSSGSEEKENTSEQISKTKISEEIVSNANIPSKSSQHSAILSDVSIVESVVSSSKTKISEEIVSSENIASVSSAHSTILSEVDKVESIGSSSKTKISEEIVSSQDIASKSSEQSIILSEGYNVESVGSSSKTKINEEIVSSQDIASKSSEKSIILSEGYNVESVGSSSKTEINEEIVSSQDIASKSSEKSMILSEGYNVESVGSSSKTKINEEIVSSQDIASKSSEKSMILSEGYNVESVGSSSKTKINEEIVSSQDIASKSSEKSIILSEGYNVESIGSSSIDLLNYKSQNEEVVETEKGSSEVGSVSSSREIIKDVLKNDEDSKKLISISKKSQQSMSGMEDEENIDELTSLKNIEFNSLVEIAELKLKENNDESSLGDDAKSIPIESKENKSTEIDGIDEKELISTPDIERESGENDVKKISELIVEMLQSSSNELISQRMNTDDSSSGEADTELQSEKSSEETASQKISDEISSKLYEEENINHITTDKFEKHFIIDDESMEKAETYQDIPSIETNSELNVPEIKTDDTTNTDISEIDDISELMVQKENIELKKDENVDVVINIHEKILRSIPGNLHQEMSANEVEESSSESSEATSKENDTANNFIPEETKFPLVESENPSEIIEEDRSELNSSKSSEEKIPYESHATSVLQDVEERNKDNSSSNSYSDDFDEDKEDASFIQEPSEVKSELDPSAKTEQKETSSDKDENEILMVKIDLPMDNSSQKEAKIVVIKEDSNEISGQDKKRQTDRLNEEEVTLKSPVQQRVSEILAKTVGSQKSIKDNKTNCQDYYVTTYEDITPVNSPESASPVKSTQIASISTFINNEAEELLKKQLAIELEIKHLEQQQKEQLPFVYMREIPNKPPPPYTPPSANQSGAITILPSNAADVKEICRYSAKVLYNAYLSNNLHAVTFSKSHFEAINKTKCTKECCTFVFDLCREIAENHYKHFQTKKVPSWLKLSEKSRLVQGKPFDVRQLENHIHSKVRELLGFKKSNIRDNSIIRWSKKKKDHVDEILVLEAQAEEQEWVNYDNDELMVKNEVTDAIFDMLLSETIEVYKNIFS